ncbi:MAG TPA: M23 family metallopeptidase [Verrucomicrobiae bacterium]|nr:M23 family metallopeptidase [Verrucomicrobiae bacterium]
MVLTVACFVVLTNVSIANHAELLETKDQSVIFSFLKTNPGLNNALFAKSNTTTILAKTDQWVTSALAQSPFSGIVLASSANTIVPDGEVTTIQDNVIVKTNPADTDNFMRHGKTVYEVTSGDSIIGIASSYGISPQTIMLENNINEGSTLRPGQKLTILPTTGVSHTIKQGETIESIAAKYKISEDDLMDINDLELPDDILAGDVLVIPLNTVEMPKPATPKFVKNDKGQVALSKATAPADFVGGAISFIWPTTTTGITQGFHRRHSGLDISNSQRVPIYASADGFVEISGYQSGYGNTIVINHGNGFKTRYAHASELYVKAGDQVVKGQTIAKQGNTGRVRGATGIHLHFEIIKNGSKVNPLSYVRP